MVMLFLLWIVLGVVLGVSFAGQTRAADARALAWSVLAGVSGAVVTGALFRVVMAPDVEREVLFTSLAALIGASMLVVIVRALR